MLLHVLTELRMIGHGYKKDSGSQWMPNVNELPPSGLFNDVLYASRYVIIANFIPPKS